MHNIQINDKSYSIPSKWNELTRIQLLYIANLFTLEIPATDFSVIALLHFLNEKRDFLKKLTPENLRFLTTAVKFLQEKITLAVQLLPEFKFQSTEGKQLTFTGTESGLANLTFLEYYQAGHYFVQFTNTKAAEDLNKLCACIYRVETRDAARLHHDTVTERSRSADPSNHHYFTRLPYPTRLAIYLFYTGCHNLLMAKFPEVFKSNGKGKKETEDLQFLNLINHLNDGDITRNDKIRKANVYEVLSLLQKQAMDAKERAAKQR